MFKKVISIILTLIATTVFTQTNNDPLYINYQFFPSRDLKNFDANSTYGQIEANMIFPGFNLGKKTIVYTNLNYKNSSYPWEGTESEYFPEQLHDIRLGFIVRHEIAENWEAILAPRLNARTDFKEKFGKRDIFPSVHLLGLRTSAKNPNFTYGLGISYNNEAKKNLVIPLAFVQYQQEEFRLYTIIPSFVFFMMTPSDKFEYGLSVNLEAGMFHIDRFNPEGSPNYLSIQNTTIAPTIAYNFYKNFWLNAKAGYAIPGKYHVLDADFEVLPEFEKNSFNGGFYANVGVSLRVSDQKSKD